MLGKEAKLEESGGRRKSGQAGSVSLGRRWAAVPEVHCWHPALGLVGGLASLKPWSEQKQLPFISVLEAKSSWTLNTSDISQLNKKGYWLLKYKRVKPINTIDLINFNM